MQIEPSESMLGWNIGEVNWSSGGFIGYPSAALILLKEKRRLGISFTMRPEELGAKMAIWETLLHKPYSYGNFFLGNMMHLTQP